MGGTFQDHHWSTYWQPMYGVQINGQVAWSTSTQRGIWQQCCMHEPPLHVYRLVIMSLVLFGYHNPVEQGEAGHAGRACLHLGQQLGQSYLDPVCDSMCRLSLPRCSHIALSSSLLCQVLMCPKRRLVLLHWQGGATRVLSTRMHNFPVCSSRLLALAPALETWPYWGQMPQHIG